MSTNPTKKNPDQNRLPSNQRAIDTDTLDGLLGFHMRLAMTKLRRSFLQHVADGAIRPGLASLLLLVSANRGISQVEVSRAMRIDKASLVPLLDKAEAAGWLRRNRSRVDRRRHELVLTRAGRKTAARIQNEIERHVKGFRDRFTENETAQLVEFLRRIYET